MPMAVGVPALLYPNHPQWREAVRFMLKICHTSQPEGGHTRYIDRPSTVEAADAAFRWLRLHRNVHRVFKGTCDRWEVWVLDLEHGYRRTTFGGPYDNPL